ncbi:MAG: VWA domain-containing protein [Proteobacteria bacterium]|nr:VWA domain-containing protein [Pseudomonadota bacterium]
MAVPGEQRQPVDLVIALDVSGSMSGLIDSAKQRLWDVVNELARANPQPDLRMAILTYGNPSYGEASGYVRIDMPFTRDLDAVNRTLFSFGTDGGDEYVSRVVHRSVTGLAWNESPDALKILFVAGNEEANQDPHISVEIASQLATNKGIVVNTIYCGNEDDNIVAGWREFSAMTNGMFASINQNASAVANIATPMDDELVRLNGAMVKSGVCR